MKIKQPSQSLSERDICSKFITPAIVKAGWDLQNQIREEVTFTDGRVKVYGKTITRGECRRADYILYYKNNFPIAVIEAKDAKHRVGDGIQQALGYAESLDVPFVFSSNGTGFLEHDRTPNSGTIESEIDINSFPSPEDLYRRYCVNKKVTPEVEEVIQQDNYEGASAHSPRYFQQVAINRTVEAVARGQKRILLVMATGTGKTYTAFQIIYRLWKSRKKKRILFLVDRTALATQTMQGDFRHFGDKMTKVDRHIADPAYEVYIALYQGLTGNEEQSKIFKQFSKDFFDLIVVDECHRGSAKENSVWREILDYYSTATQIGLTATPKETTDISTQDYFNEPVYTYSLKQGIEDGFLAPYKVLRYILDKDIEWRPNELIHDQHGNPIEDRVYNVSDYDRNIVIKERTKLVAKKITEYIKDTDPMQKAIIFCVDIDHAERLRQELVNLNTEQVKKNHRYVMRITGDNEEGKNELENFINPESPYPVLVTTSQLLSTGVDVQTCKLIVLDKPINSMSEFKQIIGRGTRIRQDFGKLYFTIMDLRGATRLFADSDFDGDPVQIYEPKEGENIGEKIEEETRSGDEIVEENPHEQVIIDIDEPEGKKEKIIISEGVEFNVASRTIQFLDPKTGKLVAESLQDYTKKKITDEYRSLDDFISAWTQAEKKDAITDALLDNGILLEELQKDVGLNIDEFDLIMHIAYGKKPLTRSERVNEVKKQDYFTKYEGKARVVLEALLEKYADQGSTAIDDIGDLNVSPFIEIGTPVEIVQDIFGGKEKYFSAVRGLQQILYSTT